MSESSPTDANKPRQRIDFTATSWTAVAAAANPNSEEAREALALLCHKYWSPLYAYARKQGYPRHEAQDLTQGFFHVLLRDNYLQTADRDRGRFRTFLLTCMKNFMMKEYRKAKAEKRGGRHDVISMDGDSAEAEFLKNNLEDETAERAFDRAWAESLLRSVRELLKEEYVKEGKRELYEGLEHCLKELVGTGDYKELAGELNMKPGTIAVAAYRLRRRYGQLLRETVSETLADPTADSVERELQHLMAVVGER